MSATTVVSHTRSRDGQPSPSDKSILYTISSDNQEDVSAEAEWGMNSYQIDLEDIKPDQGSVQVRLKELVTVSLSSDHGWIVSDCSCDGPLHSGQYCLRHTLYASDRLLRARLHTRPQNVVEAVMSVSDMGVRIRYGDGYGGVAMLDPVEALQAFTAPKGKMAVRRREPGQVDRLKTELMLRELEVMECALALAAFTCAELQHGRDYADQLRQVPGYPTYSKTRAIAELGQRASRLGRTFRDILLCSDGRIEDYGDLIDDAIRIATDMIKMIVLNGDLRILVARRFDNNGDQNHNPWLELHRLFRSAARNGFLVIEHMNRIAALFNLLEPDSPTAELDRVLQNSTRHWR